MITNSSKETEDMGFSLAKEIKAGKMPRFIALWGDLGSGKTTFMKGLAKGLGVKEDISSPTFVIFKKYKAGKGVFLYHFDAYRISSSKELSVLGFEEILSKKENVITAEWSENIEEALPKERVDVRLSFIDENKRECLIVFPSPSLRDDPQGRGNLC